MSGQAKIIITEGQKGKESRLDGECGQICNHGRKKGLKEKQRRNTYRTNKDDLGKNTG